MTTSRWAISNCILGAASCVLSGCAAPDSESSTKAEPSALISQSTDCGSGPFLSSVTLTDSANNSVSLITPNTNYNIRATGPASSFCLTLTGGGTTSGGSTSLCLDNGPFSGGIGTTVFHVVSNSTCSFTGNITPYDLCSIAQSQVDFTLPANGGCSTGRHYTCGYALPGYQCNNGRNHAFVVAADMTAAIAACHAAQPASYTDFCYVIDADGGTSSDTNECTAASASWRPTNSCCNFLGTTSCP